MMVEQGKETLSGKRPRSPTDHKSMIEKENKRPDKHNRRIHSKICTLLTTNSKHDMGSSSTSGSSCSEVDIDMRSPSPSMQDVPGSPTPSAPRLPSKLNRVLLYENTMEQRLLEQEIRRIDSQQQKGAIAIATDIARVRESSARLKESARNSTLRINSANAGGARSTLPPIVNDLNQHFATYADSSTVQSPTEVIRQRALRQNVRSAGTFFPKISKDEAKSEQKSKNIRNKISLPHLIASKYGLCTRPENIQADNSTSRPQPISHSAVMRRSVDDERFKQLQERLLDMSSVLDLEKRLRPWVLKNAAKKTTTGKRDVKDEKVSENDIQIVDDCDDENDENVYDEDDYAHNDRKHQNTPVNNLRCSDLIVNEL